MFSQNKVYPRYFFLIEEFVEMFHKAGLILCFHVNDSKPALILRQLGLQSIWQATAASGVFCHLMSDPLQMLSVFVYLL